MMHVMKQLKNPLTDEYYQLKNLVLGSDFPWFHEKNQKDNFYFYSHVFLERPNEKSLFPAVRSEYVDLFHTVIQQIFEYNNLPIDIIYRMNANAVPAGKGHTAAHTDHDFPHDNLIIYLTDAGGETVVEDIVSKTPLEDEIATFSGIHYHYMPDSKRRVVLIATYGNSSSYYT